MSTCANCGREKPEEELSSIGVTFQDSEHGTIEYCLECTDYILDTPEGESVVLEARNEPVWLDWTFYHPIN